MQQSLYASKFSRRPQPTWRLPGSFSQTSLVGVCFTLRVCLKVHWLNSVINSLPTLDLLAAGLSLRPLVVVVVVVANIEFCFSVYPAAQLYASVLQDTIKALQKDCHLPCLTPDALHRASMRHFLKMLNF